MTAMSRSPVELARKLQAFPQGAWHPDDVRTVARALLAAEEALSFYGDEDNWTQLASWGGRLFDEDSKACRETGARARLALSVLRGSDTA